MDALALFFPTVLLPLLLVLAVTLLAHCAGVLLMVFSMVCLVAAVKNVFILYVVCFCASWLYLWEIADDYFL